MNYICPKFVKWNCHDILCGIGQNGSSLCPCSQDARVSGFAHVKQFVQHDIVDEKDKFKFFLDYRGKPTENLA